jgi:chaperonin GroES
MPTMLAATTKIRPAGDRLVVEAEEQERVTPGGIHLPDIAKEKPCIGHVHAVGPGVRLADGTICPLPFKAGQRVLFSRYAGSEVAIADDGPDLLVLREGDILAVLENADGDDD